MLRWLAETTIAVAVLTGVVALVCRALRPRPAVRHALWLVVLIKLLSPPLLDWPWPASASLAIWPEPMQVDALDPKGEVPAVAGQVGTPPISGILPSGLDVREVEEARPEDAPRDAVAEPETSVLAPAATASSRTNFAPTWPGLLSWEQCILAAWLVATAGMAILQACRIVRLGRHAARAAPAALVPAALAEAVGELAARLSIAAPRVKIVPGLSSPMVWALGRPQLLWPAVLLERLRVESTRAAMVHELAHLRRRDHWTGWLELIASCLWWWNPLFWIVRRKLRSAAEAACDAWVVEVLPAARHAYAEALVEVCELVSRRAIPAPALGMGGACREVERRLIMILRESVPCQVPRRALFGVVLLALFTLPGLTIGQPPSPTPAPPAETNQPKARLSTPSNSLPGGDEREQRLQKLEATVEAVLMELRELRGTLPKSNSPTLQKQPSVTKGTTPIYPADKAPPRYYEPSINAPAASYYKYVDGERTSEPVQLTRATYSLPREKAEALAALLKDLKGPVVETQVKADGIVVTTTPAGQHIVGEFVDLLQGRKPYVTAPPTMIPAPGK